MFFSRSARRLLLSLTLVAAVVAVSTLSAQRGAQPSQPPAAPTAAQLLQSGINKQTVDGKLEEAIAVYQRIVSGYPGERAIVATALFRMAQCHEQLGNRNAQALYERVLREFGDQRDAAAQAKARLAALGPASEAAAPATVPTARVVFRGDNAWEYPSISRDGRFLAFDDGKIQDVDTGVVRKTGASNGSWDDTCNGGVLEKIVWSPDGDRLAGECTNKDGAEGVRITNVKDGTSTVLALSKDWSPSVHDWSPDGTQLLLRIYRKAPAPHAEIGLFDLKQSQYRRLLDLQKEAEWYPTSLRFSRDGRSIAYDLPKASDSGDRDIWVMPAGGGVPVAVVSDRSVDTLVDWTWDGSGLVFLSDRGDHSSLWFVPVSAGKAIGPATRIKEDVGDISVSDARVTERGIFYATGRSVRTVWMASIDLASGRVLEAPGAPGRLIGAQQDSPAWSPDGRHLAYLTLRITEAFGPYGRTISVFDVATGETRHVSIPFYADKVSGLTWLADSQWIVVNAKRPEDNPRITLKDGLRLMKVNVNSGESAEITVCREYCTPSPDGRTVYDFANDTITKRSLDTGEEVVLYRKQDTRLPLDLARLSPDGKWLAFTEDERSGTTPARETLKIVPTAGGPARTIYAPEPKVGIYVALGWSADSKHVLFNSQGQSWQVSIEEGSKPVRIALEFPWLGDYTMHPDGKRVAFFTQENPPSEGWLLENFLPKATAKGGTGNKK